MNKILLIVFSLVFFQSALIGQEAIGKVTAIAGEVTAGSRTLKLHSPIYATETVATGPDAQVQIQFTDKGLLNLIPDTEYRVSDYQYRNKGQKDRYSADLVKGGFRSLSGSIAKKNPDEYEIRTPTSTIGLRGTILDVRLLGRSLYCACESGLAVITNMHGSLLIGEKAPTQFAEVQIDRAPQALLQRPLELERGQFAAPRGAYSIQKSTAPTPRPSGGERKSSGGTEVQGAPEEREWKLPGNNGGGSGSKINPGC